MDHPPHVEADVVVDAVVVGAGIIGASSAYHLSAAGRTVAVLEARSGYAEGSSGRSFASVRSQWADHVSIELSWRSIQAYQRFEEEHGVDVGYRPTGYLLLWGEDVWARQLEAVALQRAHGVPVEVLDPADAQGLTPFATDGVAGTTYGPADGRIDPHIATGAYLGLARAAGAAVHFGSAVTGIERDTDDTWVVRTGMRTVRARYVVNAAGGWSSETAALAGISAPVVHSKRNVYASASGAADRVLPMTCDMATGVYLRSDGDRVLFGLSNPRQTDGYDTEVDWGWLEVLLGIAENRFPWLADLLGRHLREHSGREAPARSGAVRAGLDPRLRVLRPRRDAGAGGRPPRRGAGVAGCDHQPGRELDVAAALRRGDPGAGHGDLRSSRTQSAEHERVARGSAGVDPDRLRLEVGLDRLRAVLPAQTGVLHPAERRHEAHGPIAVHPHGARLDPFGHPEGPGDVTGPHPGTETEP
jgi:sarcosine oxidase subunit beta